MKTVRQRQKPTGEATRKSNVNTGLGCTRSKLPIKRPDGQRPKRKNNTSSWGKDENSMPAPKVQPSCKQLQVKGTGFPEKQNNVPRLDLELGQTLQSPAKIKLQLFPIDEITRKGLEKDGHNPHLELILSNRKKISSVLKHLNDKWGSSSTAVGEPMLFPYSICLENLGAYRRWTLKDRDTSASDVYSDIGKPAIFRLRYGWFPNLQPKTLGGPLRSPCSEGSAQTEYLKKDCTRNVEITDTENKTVEVASKEDRPHSISDAPNKTVSQLDGVAETLGSSKAGDVLTLSSSLWADSITNISIGGLLSEASLHAAAPSRDGAKPSANDSRLHQIPFSCDSFDAAIAAHIYRSAQEPQQSANAPHSSILDAEETCHAFSFQKFGTSGKDQPSSKTALSGSWTQDVNTKSFKFPSSLEGKKQAESTQDHASQEPKSCTSLQTLGGDNAVRNLGIADLNWSDSMGSLEGLLSSRQLINGDSISLSGLFANSLDAFQNCSLFANGGKGAP